MPLKKTKVAGAKKRGRHSEARRKAAAAGLRVIDRDAPVGTYCTDKVALEVLRVRRQIICERLRRELQDGQAHLVLV